MNWKIGAAALAAMALTGCASITDGTTQTLIFNLQPKETMCVLTRNGEELGSVNGKQNTLLVGKGARDIVARCAAPGFDDKTIRMVSSTQTSGVVGGLFLDLGITDMITGAMWKYDGTVNVILTPTLVQAPVAAPLPMAAAAAPMTPSVAVPQQPVAAATPQMQYAVMSVSPNGEPAKPQTLAVGQVVSATGARVEGQWAYEAERVPEVKACSGRPTPTLVTRSAAAETYSVPCSNGEFLTVRCENLGGCRTLQ